MVYKKQQLIPPAVLVFCSARRFCVAANHCLAHQLRISSINKRNENKQRTHFSSHFVASLCATITDHYSTLDT